MASPDTETRIKRQTWKKPEPSGSASSPLEIIKGRFLDLDDLSQRDKLLILVRDLQEVGLIVQSKAATQVSVERVFSNMPIILTDRRGRLNNDNYCRGVVYDLGK